MNSPLRVLVIVASPKDAPQFDAGVASSDLAEALQPLKAQGLIALEWVTPATEIALKKRLKSESWDVLHFIGHAKWRPAAQYGTLLLESSTGTSRSVSTQYFGDVVQSVKLVVLQISEAAGKAWDDEPAVLIDAGPLVHPSQGIFARKFYASLASGATLGDATAHARAALASVGAARTLTLQQGAESRLVSVAAVAAPTVVQSVAPLAVPQPVPVDTTFLQELRRKRACAEFDVFLCHNSSDKPQVRQLADQLESQGILPWLDERELPPGQPWQPLLEQQIASIHAAAVFVGAAGVGPWQEQELYGFLREFVARKNPVIPVLLRDAAEKPKLPIFLRGMTWVDFRVNEPEPLSRLIWGITGRRPHG
jgi:nucleotide-binding universal stress UspA family protein